MTKRKRLRVPVSSKNFRFLKRMVISLVSLALVGGALFLEGTVVSVADGDTLTIATLDSTKRKIRLYGIDAPELQQKSGKDAARYLEAQALWRHAEVKVMNKDQYGREVAIVTLPDGTVLNELLVREGHAWVYRQYCVTAECSRWLELEQNARQYKKGLWQYDTPIPPWKWRRKR